MKMHKSPFPGFTSVQMNVSVSAKRAICMHFVEMEKMPF